MCFPFSLCSYFNRSEALAKTSEVRTVTAAASSLDNEKVVLCVDNEYFLW
jgi:hypothetical protein